MENLLTDVLKSQLGNVFTEKAAQAASIDSNKSQSMIQAALPFLIGALAKNSADPKGAQALDQALAKDHNGSIFDHMDDLFADPDASEGSGILKHLFGSNRSAVEAAMAKEVGAKPEQAESMLKMLAPVVMGALGKAKAEQGLDSNGLSNLLQLSVKGLSGGDNGISMNMAMKFLDADNDGKISDDLMEMGKRFIKKRFGGQ